MTPPVTLSWANSADERRDAAIFLAAAIGDDPAYISHSEVQQALSPDGNAWASDLSARLMREFSHEDAGRSVALARQGATLAGIASLQWETEAPLPHAILADLAVTPGLRDQGIGAALVAFAEAEAMRRGLGAIFLESGLRNKRAHAFFERNGFHPLSKVFMKRL